jgi:Xaa-Pro aminopeptidase
VIHYKPEKGSCGIIDPNAIYLCDSGAQFFDGTTDTTRTLHFGTPTKAEKTAYTLVLKGNIALDSAVFPKGTSGFAIDCLARQFLWVSLLTRSQNLIWFSHSAEIGSRLSPRNWTRCGIVSLRARGPHWNRY